MIDWLSILQQMPQVPEHDQRLAEAQQVLKARLSYTGSQVGFSTDAQDQWWWLMQSADVNVARLLLTTLDDAAWDAERTRLVTGLLASLGRTVRTLHALKRVSKPPVSACRALAAELRSIEGTLP